MKKIVKMIALAGFAGIFAMACQKAPDQKTPAGLTDNEFADVCAKYNLLLVPGKNFIGEGYCRLAFCVSEKTIVNSRKAFFDIAKELGI